ncbi:hypothetical protein F2P56_022098 [Juglans regia]|uniref:GRF-type domain-containing protein n=2 Tax=Juglans regia TaxID=51240 RepID=A0A833WNG9_JUGRE|nr:uncharacterized protein LOC108980802 [Juglans regia]KAF5458033.1 hypothetical protein F2P56_022098 [Juglans regia]
MKKSSLDAAQLGPACARKTSASKLKVQNGAFCISFSQSAQLLSQSSLCDFFPRATNLFLEHPKPFLSTNSASLPAIDVRLHPRHKPSRPSHSSPPTRCLSQLSKCDFIPDINLVVLRISNTRRNPRRLFFGCPQFNKEGIPYCKYFKWADNPDVREKAIVTRETKLLRKDEALKSREKEIEKREFVLHNNEALLQKQLADMQHARRLLHVSWLFIICISLYLMIKYIGTFVMMKNWC